MRLGTPAVTSRGFKEPEMKDIARFIKEATFDFDASKDRITEEVIALCERFPIYTK